MRDSTPKSNSQAGLLLQGPKTIRGEAAQVGRKEAVPSRTEGIPSWAEGNPSQSEGIPNRAEGNPSRAEGIPNVCPSVKSKSFNGLRSTPAGGLGVTPKMRARLIRLNFCGRRRLRRRAVRSDHEYRLPGISDLRKKLSDQICARLATASVERGALGESAKPVMRQASPFSKRIFRNQRPHRKDPLLEKVSRWRSVRAAAIGRFPRWCDAVERILDASTALVNRPRDRQDPDDRPPPFLEIVISSGQRRAGMRPEAKVEEIAFDCFAR
jgi:hypothetical protein